MSGIIRVYKRNDEGVLDFREAWFDEDYSQFVMNHGVVGHQSKPTRPTSPMPQPLKG